MTKQIDVTVMIKDGGYASIRINPKMLELLAQRIVQNGSERVITMTKSIEVVGVLVQGQQIGDRVIITGKGEEEAK